MVVTGRTTRWVVLLGVGACTGDPAEAEPDCPAGQDCADGGSDGGSDDTGSDDPGPDEVVVTPTAIDDVLVNPGMGVANFHFGWWCNLPPVTYSAEECAERVRAQWPDNYPDAGTAYFRWTWAELEPERGELDTAMIDATIQSANALNETLGIRVYAIEEGGLGVPEWLTEAPYEIDGEWIDGMFWPDVRDPVFLAEHQRMLEALGARYDDHPGIDHVDIGTVGCWGEWNTACLSSADDIFDVYGTESEAELDEVQAAYETMVDHHIDAFPNTPTVMLGIGASHDRDLDILLHATDRGAGWRVDCWGDWGFWGDWTHMEHEYPVFLEVAEAADPTFPDVVAQAPIQLETCGVMSTWEGYGWTTEAPDGEVLATFEWAEEVGASVLNAKFSAVPDAYVDALDDLLRRNGYRFGLAELVHAESVESGGELVLTQTWRNEGVAPTYRPRTLSWRLEQDGVEVTRFESTVDIRGWQPGSHEVVDTWAVPADLAAGSYSLAVALLDRDGADPVTPALPPLQLAMEGRGDDGWTVVSEVDVP